MTVQRKPNWVPYAWPKFNRTFCSTKGNNTITDCWVLLSFIASRNFVQPGVEVSYTGLQNPGAHIWCQRRWRDMLAQQLYWIIFIILRNVQKHFPACEHLRFRISLEKAELNSSLFWHSPLDPQGINQLESYRWIFAHNKDSFQIQHLAGAH